MPAFGSLDSLALPYVVLFGKILGTPAIGSKEEDMQLPQTKHIKALHRFGCLLAVHVIKVTVHFAPPGEKESNGGKGGCAGERLVWHGLQQFLSVFFQNCKPANQKAEGEAILDVLKEYNLPLLVTTVRMWMGWFLHKPELVRWYDIQEEGAKDFTENAYFPPFKSLDTMVKELEENVKRPEFAGDVAQQEYEELMGADMQSKGGRLAKLNAVVHSSKSF